MTKKRNWILLADGGNARIMERVAPFGKLKEVLNLTHTHESTHQHGNDRPGRGFESASPARHAYEPRSDWHELQKEGFAKEIATLIKDAYHTKKFEELSIFSAPHMLGLLRHHLNKNALSSKIVKEYPKDILALPLGAVQDYIDNLPVTKTT
jgi:protein required for attachment to host cells